MKTINTTYPRTDFSKFKVTRVDGIIDGPDYFNSYEEVQEHIKSEEDFNSDTDSDSFQIETL